MLKLLFALLLAPMSVFAQGFPLSSELPQCEAALSGRAMCRDGIAFECRFSRPGSMQRGSGWLWQTNILLPCEATPVPADLPTDRQMDLPPGFIFAPQINGYGTQSGRSGMQVAPRSGQRP
jgi:hypothetical protein